MKVAYVSRFSWKGKGNDLQRVFAWRPVLDVWFVGCLLAWGCVTRGGRSLTVHHALRLGLRDVPPMKGRATREGTCQPSEFVCCPRLRFGLVCVVNPAGRTFEFGGRGEFVQGLLVVAARFASWSLGSRVSGALAALRCRSASGDLLARTIPVGRTEVVDPCRSCANL